MEHLNWSRLNLYLTIVIGLLTAACFFIKRSYSYWERKGVPSIKPQIPYGSMRLFNKESLFAFITKEFYDKMKARGPFCGIYVFHRPVALLLDQDLIKRILIKDFAHFHDRGLYYNEKHDPLSAHLFALDGQPWRTLRRKLSPTFTSGRMKFMYPTIIDVADRFKEHLNELLDGDNVFEFKELLGKFTTDTIGTCAFGIECNSFKDPNAKFSEMCRREFQDPRHSAAFGLMIESSKKLSRFLGIKATRSDVLEFFMKVVTETVEFREKNSITRNDFMDLLIKLKNKETDEEGLCGLTLNEVAAQAFVFFLAGFETSSTTLAFCLYELVINPDIQQRARLEIRQVLKKHNGHCSYEAMMEMHYIDQIINETLRKYPVVTVLIRESQKDYPVAGTDFVIEKGTPVWIPTYGIHHDPEYYPDPEKFDPARFSQENVANRDSTQWLPFGDGPRNCIGLRFGMMQARIGLIMLLNNFEFSVSSKMNVPLKLSRSGFFMIAPEGGMWLTTKRAT